MNKILVGVLCGIPIGLLLFIPAFYLYALSGAAPVATSAKELPLEHLMAKTALHATMDSAYPKEVPVNSDNQTFLAAAPVYSRNCAVCHGVPDGVQSAIAIGMFPKPPQLFQTKDMVTDDPPGETFWKEKNGIRLTGMPGFGGQLTDEEMWQVSVLLANADKLSPEVIRALSTIPSK